MISKAIKGNVFFANETEFICAVLFDRNLNEKSKVNEEVLLDLLQFHRVEQRFRKKIKSDHTFSEDFKDKLNQICTENIAQELQLTSCFFEIAKVLNTRNIPIYAFKGPILSYQLHKDFTLRTYRDCDFLVNVEDLQKVIDYFTAHSWTWIEAKFEGKKQQKAFFKIKNHITFTNESGLVFEVHIFFSSFIQNKEVLNAGLLANAETIDFPGVKLQVLCKEDYFIYLCLHGVRHFFFRISWIADLIYFLEKEDINFTQKVIEKANIYECTELIKEVLLYLDSFQHTKELDKSKLTNLFIEFQQETMIEFENDKPMSFFKQFKFHYSLIYYTFAWKGLFFEWRMRRNRPENWSFFVFKNQFFKLNLIFSEFIYIVRKLTKN